MAKKVRKQDVTKLVGLLHGISSQASQVTNQIQSILKQVQDGDISTNKGISFLEVKYQTMLSYLTNLTYLMLQKAKGQQLSGDPAIERIVEARTVIEKMRPIDHKLRYQVDKLVKVATTGLTSENDPLRFKPNPDNLISKLDEEEEESSEEDEVKTTKKKDDKPRKYVPPRVAAMHYDGDETVKDRQERALQKAKKRALSSTLMQELRAEYNDAPDEILETTNVHKLREDREAKHKLEYEEDNFVRLPITRKEKQAQRRVMTESSLASLARFDDISILGQDGSAAPPKKRKKMASKLRKGKKKSSKKKWK